MVAGFLEWDRWYPITAPTGEAKEPIKWPTSAPNKIGENPSGDVVFIIAPTMAPATIGVKAPTTVHV